MAIVYYAQAKYPEALKLHEDVLAIRVAKLGLEHLDTAKTQNNIGAVYHAQGKLSEALEMWQKSLATKEKVLGHDHPSVADTYNKCAHAHPCKACWMSMHVGVQCWCYIQLDG
jgi:tetratricopeptide (TPR) repeat protein